MLMDGHLEVFSCLQAIEKYRQFLLFQTAILQKTVVGCPKIRQDKTRKTRLNKRIDDNVELPKASTVVILFLL